MGIFCIQPPARMPHLVPGHRVCIYTLFYCLLLSLLYLTVWYWHYRIIIFTLSTPVFYLSTPSLSQTHRCHRPSVRISRDPGDPSQPGDQANIRPHHIIAAYRSLISMSCTS